ncbi:hypothetical protein DY000_02035668 [Brassica cretica]|uniref:Secreted protein n=1 Tax=Brassica cretica TaxID=69181 RepID=A0ABQ7DXK7_BRACR|nr:hypothetical protein DY000_02035668 [Brassica cretica]
MNHLPLTPSVLLSLLLHLAGDINKDTSCKLVWMTCVASAIDTSDPSVAICGPSIFEQVGRSSFAIGDESSFSDTIRAFVIAASSSRRHQQGHIM